MQDYIKRKFWKPVIDALGNLKETSAYYAGSTLFIPLKDHVTIALNLDGRGFVLNKNHPLGLNEELPVYIPAEVLTKVRRAYISKRNGSRNLQKVK